MSNKLVDRLNKGPVICAEGFLFEIERRGYMASGEFVPMVSLDHRTFVDFRTKIDFLTHTMY